jgi:hypothetical protein
MAVPARALLLGAGVLLALAAPRRLAAQAPGFVLRGDTVRLAASAGRPMAERSGRCLSLEVVPGDTAGRAMPRALADTSRVAAMPRTLGTAPACASVPRTASASPVVPWPEGAILILPSARP